MKVNGRRCVFNGGLVVSTKKSDTLRFGEYTFKASNVSRMDNEIVLSGIVTMNDWLGFSGPVSLKGDFYYGDSIVLNASGAYISYDKGAAGLDSYASILAQKGAMIRLPQITGLRLYRNSGTAASSPDFYTENAYLDSLEIPGLVRLNGTRIAIFPDRIMAGFDEFTSLLPLNSEIVRFSEKNNGFVYSNSSGEPVTISKKSVKCNITVSESYTEGRRIRAKLGNMGISLNTESYEITIDTENSVYRVRNIIGIPLVYNNFVLELNWDNGSFKSASLTNQEPFESAVSGENLVYSDFVMKLDDAAGKALSDMVLEGTCRAADKSAPPTVFDNIKLKFALIDRSVSMTMKDKTSGADSEFRLGPGAFYADPLASGSAIATAVLANIDMKAVMAG